ncbi:hypothetical protein L211DRAFT_850287 [Terfezia boudieri ATCC MYA-4762]|uniref:Uncharacterized protein n=1 Tax=Terfezia boudieri ATCC MYA-4762 TaxID=1051890 RepID=A0A3N4LIZ2_9PEZI|nr:hypothetical protein L211DRAFT_850287 [Terfezia boudieri ATCC MYA-4762]
MTEIAPVMSSAGLTPPSSPLLSHQDMNTSSQTSSPQPIARSRRLRHSKSPIFPSPDYRIPHTSLYQFPSDGSLASAYASHSNAGSPKLQTDAKMFTAVIPPLAAVPPTAPLPPTPPKQGAWEELSPQVSVEVLESRRKSKSKKVEVVVGIIKDVRAEKEADRRGRSLRRMKGNVGEAISAQITKTIPRPDATDSGLPTPGPTPPSSAKIVTPPRTLHHPKPYKLPVRKLDFSKSNRSSYSEAGAVVYSGDGDDGDDDDGGIAIEYVDEPQDSITSERVRRPAVLDLGKLSVPGMDLPRPDSPFVTGFAIHFDEGKGVDETEAESPTRYGYGSENEGVRLSAGKRSFPEFIHSPKRIDSDRAELMELEASQPNSPTDFGNTEMVMAAQDTPASVEGNDSVLVPPKDTQLDSRGGSKEEKAAKNEKGKSSVNLIIQRSSILKRRHPSNTSEGNKVAIDEPEGLISPPPYSGSWDIAHNGSNTQNIFTPPQLPRFNFIPATPLPLMSPTSVFEKQLGGHGIFLIGTTIAEEGEDMPPPSSDTTPNPITTRLSMARSRTVRDNRLHPWWRPRSYYLAEDASFAKLLEGTSFTRGESESTRKVAPERDFESKPKPRAEWTEYGPVKVDKKRKLVGVGGVQVQWVGFGGW